MDNEVKEITQTELDDMISKSVEKALEGKQLDSKTVVVKEEEDEAKKAKKFESVKKFFTDLIEGKAISTDVSSFGYTIPTALADEIATKKDKIAKIRKYAFSFKLAGNFQLPTEGTGVTAYWVGDNAEITESNPTIGKKSLADYYLAGRVLIPRSLLNTSAYNISNFVSQLISRAIRNAEETAFVAGDGSAKPTGLRTASVGSVAQAGANLVYDDIVNLFYTLKEQYRETAVFLTSSAGVKLIRGLKDNNGMPIFDPRDQTLWNKPLLESEDIPSNLGSGGDETEIWFGDLSYYWIKDGEQMFADTGKIVSKLQLELVVAEAVDGILTLTDAFKKLTGVK